MPLYTLVQAMEQQPQGKSARSILTKNNWSDVALEFGERIVLSGITKLYTNDLGCIILAVT